MFVNRILIGDNAGLYLPFGMSRLRALQQANDADAYFSQQYIIDDYTIKVSQAPPYAFVKIIQAGGGAYFEFFASGKPVVTDTVVDPISGTFTNFKTATVGVDIAPAGASVKTSPQILGGKRFDQTALASAIGQEHQVNLANEPNAVLTKGAEKPTSKFPRLLYESWAPMHSNTFIFTRHFSREASVSGGFASNLERDVTYDVPYGMSTGKNFIKFAYLFGSADWPRSSGLQTVVDAAFGTREFAVYIDASSQIWVFPTSILAGGRGPSSVNDAVVSKYVKGIAVTFPSWAFHASSEFKTTFAVGGLAATQELPEIDWRPHPDGTKACAVVWKRVPLTYDSAYFAGLAAGSADPAAGFTAAEGVAGYAWAAGIGYPADTERYLLAPGLLETTINITLTGTNPEDFSISGATSTIRDPETCPFGTLLAGYVWHDIPDPFGSATPVAHRGDLCVLDVEVYWDPTVAGTPNIQTFTRMVKNLTTDKDVIPLNGSRVNDFDMKTLSFATELTSLSTYTIAVPIRPGYPVGSSGTGPTVPDDGHSHKKLPATTDVIFSVGHPQLAIYTFAKVREVLYPPGIPDAQKLSWPDVTPINARADLAGLTFLPMNDISDWSTHTELRNWLSSSFKYTSTTYSLSTTSETAFYNQILGALSEMMFLLVPRFGFYAYANQLMQSMRKHPRSILFAHPNGSWGYFDTNLIYNQNGIPVPGLAFYNTLDMFDVSKLSIALFDRLHLVSGSGSLDTSFIDTYNKAITSSTGSNAITESMLPLSAADFTPTFTIGSYNFTVPAGTTIDDDGKVFTWLELAAHFPTGDTYYIHDTAYITGAPEQGFVAYGSEAVNSPSLYGGGNLFQQAMDAAWTTGPGYTGSFSNPTIDFGRCAFSTPTLIVS